jgi:hypothetical protein
VKYNSARRGVSGVHLLHGRTNLDRLIIVTGDRHLLKLKQHDSIRILKLVDFVAAARGRGVS